MRKRDLEKHLERLSAQFKQTPHISSKGGIEVCTVWYDSDKKILRGVGRNNFYPNCIPILVGFDLNTNMPSAKVVDNRADIYQIRAVEFRISEVLRYIQLKEQKR